MDEQTFQRKMAELLERIRELPGGSVSARKLARGDSSTSNGASLNQSIEELQESLDYLRLSVKYLVFDLEATRRENTYLRRLVERANRERDRGKDADRDVDDLFDC